jgi:predicted dehydrogenase
MGEENLFSKPIFNFFFYRIARNGIAFTRHAQNFLNLGFVSGFGKRIGRIYSIEGKYTFNISDLGTGWRAQKSSAGGGVLVDMGYHLIDLLIWYFGIPDSVTARISRGNRPGQKYDVEDTANMLFDFHFSSSDCEKTIGNFLISRVYPKKEEALIVYGTKGIVELRRGEIRRLDVNGKEIEKLTRQESWPSALVDQVDYFGKEIESGKKWGIECLKNHIPHVAVIQAAYDSDERSASCYPKDYLEKIIGGA